MAKRGKTPSLVSAHGAVKMDTSGKRSPCKRCGEDLLKGQACVRVAMPDGRNGRTYCLDCFSEVLEQTQADLNEWRAAVEAARL